MAFLAINSVDVNRDPYRSPAQISSYCSISASIGGIILGLILVRQNQTKHTEISDVVSNSTRVDSTPITSFPAKLLKQLRSSLAWSRNSSDHVQLAVCIANVGVSAFVCQCDVFKPCLI